MCVIKEIELTDGDKLNEYVINVTHWDKENSHATFANTYDDDNSPTGYNNGMAEDLFRILKGELDPSLLILHLNAAAKGSLHSMIAYQLLKIPNSIVKFTDKRSHRGRSSGG